jgi:hypothetical protein
MQKLIWVIAPERVFRANMLPALTAAVFAGSPIIGHSPCADFMSGKRLK